MLNKTKSNHVKPAKLGAFSRYWTSLSGQNEVKWLKTLSWCGKALCSQLSLSYREFASAKHFYVYIGLKRYTRKNVIFSAISIAVERFGDKNF